MIRKTIFWIHLACGLLAGLVIFSLSFTGVVLTYERQINNWVGESHYVPVEEQVGRLALDELLHAQQHEHPDVTATTLVLQNDLGAPVAFRAGRRGGVQLNPYTGEEMETSNPALEQFFRTITSFHRWFSLEGDNRNIAREIVGVSNLIFLFLLLSGLYLWLPRMMKWGLLKARIFLRGSYPTSKARDYHWHHIFGLWTAIPLLAIIYTGAMFHYSWPTNLLYSAFGVEPPVRGQRGAPPGANQGPGGGAPQQLAESVVENTLSFLSMEALIEVAIADSEKGWNNLNITLPTQAQESLDVVVDWGNGAQSHKRHTLSIDRSTGEITDKATYADSSLVQKIGGVRRYLHTGELFGFVGQTIAGLASLAALFMVWTGFALSYRRLIQPLFRKK